MYESETCRELRHNCRFSLKIMRDFHKFRLLSRLFDDKKVIFPGGLFKSRIFTRCKFKFPLVELKIGTRYASLDQSTFDSTHSFETVQLGFDCNHRNSF